MESSNVNDCDLPTKSRSVKMTKEFYEVGIHLGNFGRFSYSD